MAFPIFEKKLAMLALGAGLMMAGPGHAQYSSDIDIYSGASGGSAPNVLFVLDNSANWNSNISTLSSTCYYKDNGVTTTSGPGGTKKFSIEMCALYNAIDALPVGANDTALFNIGFMFFNDTNVGTGARAIKAFTPLTSAGKAALKTLIKSLDATASQSGSPTSYAPALHEAYLYFTLSSPLYGQPAGTTPPYDTAAFSAGKYTLPLGSNCGRNYVIMLANGAPQSDQISNTTMQAKLLALGGNTTKISYASGIDPKDSDNWTDEYARYLSSQNIITYAIAVTGASSDKTTYPNIFKGIAKEGGGDFYEAKTADSLALALGDIFTQLQAVNSVFSSASLPVSVNARGTYLNQIFMGTFRPDSTAKPRWRGNLKQYKFGYDPITDNLFLTDSTGKPAISGATGFLSPSAISYWTETSTFWTNQTLGTPLSASDSPDGEVVEKGGVAQQIRKSHATEQASRNMLTCLSCTTSGTNLTAFNSTTVTSLTASLVNWARGTDNNSPTDEKGPGGTVTVRPSVHGDVLHSRPAVVNYGGPTGEGVLVFYGSNDGTLRAVNGAQTGATAGHELWSFVPEEHFSKLNRLAINSPEVRLSVGSSPSATSRDYFVDGPIGIYQKVATTGTNEKVILFVAMRRGGRILYALDVTAPATPKFLWKKTEADISVLGQTWSEPKVARIRGNANPVLIMGAGYDAAAEDVSPQGTTTMGNAVLVLDAITGTLLKKFDTTRSVPADVSLVDTDFDGYVDRAYAVDMGGNVYRIDLEKTVSATTTSAVSDWGIYKLAALSGSGTRKFFYPPDVVVTNNYTAVLVGSGDREKPLATTSTDAFFTLYDTLTGKGTPSSAPTAITSSSLGLVGSSESLTNGCYIPMATTGEKIVNAPVSVGGITYFSTNRPAPVSTNSCSANLGIAKVYSAPLFCKAATAQTLIGGGLPPSPVTGTVTVSYTSPITGEPVTKRVPFIIGAPNSKGSGIEGSKVTPIITPVRKRRYWYLENAR